MWPLSGGFFRLALPSGNRESREAGGMCKADYGRIKQTGERGAAAASFGHAAPTMYIWRTASLQFTDEFDERAVLITQEKDLLNFLRVDEGIDLVNVVAYPLRILPPA